MNVLEVESVHAGYGGTQIVDDVSLKVEKGEVVCILGRNGMGKSTLLKSMLGLIRRSAGAVHVGGQPVDEWPVHRIVRLGVGYAAQERAIFHELTVAENLNLVRSRAPHGKSMASVLELLPALTARLNQRAGSLSGGEQKMLVLAGALAGPPELVILDEVVEGVQPSLVEQFMEIIESVNRDAGTAFLIVEQNVDFALKLASRFVVMSGGRVVEEGNTSTVERSAIERHFIL